MPPPHVISTLIDKRARVAGELEAAKRLVIDLRIKLIHVDACLRMLDDGIEPKSIQAKATNTKNPAGLPKGAGSRWALDILRESGEALDVQELARRVLISKGREVMPDAVRMLANTIHSSFSRHRKGVVSYDRGTWPGKWRITR